MLVRSPTVLSPKYAKWFAFAPSAICVFFSSTKLPICTSFAVTALGLRRENGPIWFCSPTTALSNRLYGWTTVPLAMWLFLITQPAPLLTLSPKVQSPSIITLMSISTSLPTIKVPRKSKRLGSMICTPCFIRFSAWWACQVRSRFASWIRSFTPSISNW